MNASEVREGVLRVLQISTAEPFRHLSELVGAARSRGPLKAVELPLEVFDAVCLDPGFGDARLQTFVKDPLRAAEQPRDALELYLQVNVLILP